MGSVVRWVGKAKLIWSEVSVEPMFALYSAGYTVSAVAMQNLNLDKACRVNLGYNETVCRALDERRVEDYMEAEDNVQDLISSMNIWKSFLQSILPAVLIPFIGSWSDRNRRRKPCMLCPLAGEILNLIAFFICTYFFLELPMEVSGLSEAVFLSVTGGWVTMYMGVFSYLGDLTSVESRTLRVGIANLCPTISVTLGTIVSGILIQLIGYYGVFSVSGVILFLAFFSAWRIKEQPSNSSRASTNIIAFLIDFFDTKHLKETLKTTFKKTKENRRMRVILLLAGVVVVSGPWQGEMSVMYNFTRLRFNWNEVNFTIFQTFLMVINLIGTAITVGLFSHRMKMDDALIGVISCVSKILAGFIYAFATETWVFYLAPLVDIANGTSYIALRSMASKLVPPDELGKLNSVFGMAEALVPVLYQPVYNALYNRTRQTLPGAFFLVGGAFTAPAIVIFLWMYGQHKQDAKELEKADCEKKKCDENVALSKKPVTNEIAETSESTAKLVPNIEVSQELEMKKRNTESLNNDHAFEDVDINEKSVTNEIAESSANSVQSVEGNQDLDIKQRNIESCHSNHAFEDDNKISRL